MNSSEKDKLKQQLSSQGFGQSSYDPNKWMRGSDVFKFEGNNRLNNNGTTTYGYGNSKDRIGKK